MLYSSRKSRKHILTYHNVSKSEGFSPPPNANTASNSYKLNQLNEAQACKHKAGKS